MAGDLALRRGHDPIHSTRVAARRYRSALRVFADLVDAPRAQALDAELAWYAGLLGEIRDRQVLRKHFAAAIDALPPQLVVAEVGERVDEHLGSGQLKARAELTKAMRGARYLALVRELQSWHREPPFVAGTDKRADEVARYLNHAERKLARRLKSAAAADADDAVLHRARKAGKRLRYTAELAEPVLGKSAARTVRRATRLQDILGEHQDSVIAAQVLLQLGAGTRTENGFSFGLLYAGEQARGRKTRREARRFAARYH